MLKLLLHDVFTRAYRISLNALQARKGRKEEEYEKWDERMVEEIAGALEWIPLSFRSLDHG